MATAVGLSFQLTASSVGMSQGVNDAANQLNKLGASAKKAASDLGVLRTIEIGRAFLSSVDRIGTSFLNYVSGIDKSVESTGNLSRELGISFEQLSQLQFAAELSGASTEDLARAFTKAQVTITKAASGGREAVQALAQIGLSAADFQGLTSSEQFTLIANAISSIADPAQRAAAAVAIFGRSGAELLPVFRDLGTFVQLAQENFAKFQGGVSQADADAVASIGDAFSLVSKDIEIVATQVLAKLAPALTQASAEFITFLASLDIAAVAETAASAISAVSSALSVAFEVAQVLAPVVSVIGDVIKFIGDNGQGAAVGLAAAATALGLYKVATIAATVATVGLGTAVRALLASTGIGLLVTVFGTVAGAALEWGLSTKTAGDEAKKGVDGVVQAAEGGANAAKKLGTEAAAAQQKAFLAAEEAAKKAADEAKKASDAARREADQSIARLVTEQQFGGDSQRYAAAQAVEAIQADILRTEQEIAAARKSGDQDALSAATKRLSQLDQALAREQDIASGARKAAAERLKLEADYAKAREAFDERRLAALSRPSTELLQLEDTRTASGYAALQRFSADQGDDPALQEYRKQLKELQKIRAELAKLDGGAATVDIIGG